MNVVGINFSIDSAAALVSGGRRVAAAAEERFSRVKHDTSFPGSALSFILKQAGMKASDVDAYAFFWNPGRHIEPMLSRNSRSFRHHAEFLYSLPNHLLQLLGQPGVDRVEQSFVLENAKRLAVHYLDHHVAHAAAAFFNSPFDSSAVLTVDGYGERNAVLIGVGEGNRIRPLHRIDFPHSVGALYAAVTQYLGFKPNSGEGKVMGLASYGDRSLYDKMRPLVRLTDDGFELDLSYFSFTMERTRRFSPRLVELFGPERKAESEITHHHENVAAALQFVTEDILLHLANLARRKTGSKNLCIAGGVALNCVANRRIMLECGFDRIFILPPAGDQGACLGAAQYVAHVLHDEPRDPAEYVEYLGFENTPEEIAAAVKTSGAASACLPDAEHVAARLLARGKIVGWFQGRAELGPRALGNRSIVADPRPAEMKDILNARVKFREPFRPFAPSCLVESCGDLFDSAVPSPFMLRVYNTLPHRLKDLAAITHVDGGARVQTVSASQNPRYYKLIKEFGKRTGVDCILNTSFNIRGEPIVNTVKEALFCFFGTDMDYLVAGDWLVAKSREALQEALAD
jgi:carbamoyltransferase